MDPAVLRSFPRLAVGWLVLTAAQAQNGSTFPIAGIGAGQTARLNAVNLAGSDSANPGSCNVTLQFLSTSGAVLKQSVTNLQPGAVATLDLAWSDLTGYTLRAEFRAVLLFGYSGGANPPARILQQSSCARLTPSLEVFDSGSGKTLLILTQAVLLPPPVRPAQ